MDVLLDAAVAVIDAAAVTDMVGVVRTGLAVDVDGGAASAIGLEARVSAGTKT